MDYSKLDTAELERQVQERTTFLELVGFAAEIFTEEFGQNLATHPIEGFAETDGCLLLHLGGFAFYCSPTDRPGGREVRVWQNPLNDGSFNIKTEGPVLVIRYRSLGEPTLPDFEENPVIPIARVTVCDRRQDWEEALQEIVNGYGGPGEVVEAELADERARLRAVAERLALESRAAELML